MVGAHEDGVEFSDVVGTLEKIEAYVASARPQLECNTKERVRMLLDVSSFVQGPELRPYQLMGIGWILALYENGLNGILADEMGLGKTAQIIASMALMLEAGAPGPFLVVVPLSVLHSWSEQINVFAPNLPHVIYYGSNEERLEMRNKFPPRTPPQMSDEMDNEDFQNMDKDSGTALSNASSAEGKNRLGTKYPSVDAVNASRRLTRSSSVPQAEIDTVACSGHPEAPTDSPESLNKDPSTSDSENSPLDVGNSIQEHAMREANLNFADCQINEKCDSINLSESSSDKAVFDCSQNEIPKSARITDVGSPYEQRKGLCNTNEKSVDTSFSGSSENLKDVFGNPKKESTFEFASTSVVSTSANSPKIDLSDGNYFSMDVGQKSIIDVNLSSSTPMYSGQKTICTFTMTSSLIGTQTSCIPAPTKSSSQFIGPPLPVAPVEKQVWKAGLLSIVFCTSLVKLSSDNDAMDHIDAIATSVISKKNFNPLMALRRVHRSSAYFESEYVNAIRLLPTPKILPASRKLSQLPPPPNPPAKGKKRRERDPSLPPYAYIGDPAHLTNLDLIIDSVVQGAGNFRPSAACSETYSESISCSALDSVANYDPSDAGDGGKSISASRLIAGGFGVTSPNGTLVSWNNFKTAISKTTEWLSAKDNTAYIKKDEHDLLRCNGLPIDDVIAQQYSDTVDDACQSIFGVSGGTLHLASTLDVQERISDNSDNAPPSFRRELESEMNGEGSCIRDASYKISSAGFNSSPEIKPVVTELAIGGNHQASVVTNSVDETDSHASTHISPRKDYFLFPCDVARLEKVNIFNDPGDTFQLETANGDSTEVPVLVPRGNIVDERFLSKQTGDHVSNNSLFSSPKSESPVTSHESNGLETQLCHGSIPEPKTKQVTINGSQQSQDAANERQDSKCCLPSIAKETGGWCENGLLISGPGKSDECPNKPDMRVFLTNKGQKAVFQEKESPNDFNGLKEEAEVPQGICNTGDDSLISPKGSQSFEEAFVKVSSDEVDSTPPNAVVEETETPSATWPVVITTYEVAIRDCSFLSKINFSAMVVDEAQRIKRSSSKLYRCLQTYDSDIRLIVTGTPLQNNISELWALLHFVLPEIFPMVAEFAEWFDPAKLVEQVGRDRLAAQETEHALVTNLRNIIRPFMLRRTKAEADVKLPPKREVILRILMSSSQQGLYDYALGKILANSALVTPTKLSTGSMSQLDETNILPRAKRRCAANLVGRLIDNSDSSSDDSELPAVNARQESRKVSPSYEESQHILVEEDMTGLSVKKIETDEYRFLKDAVTTSKLMLLRRIVNHSFLALERPPIFEEIPIGSQDSVSSDLNDHILTELLNGSGKLRLLDRLLQKLIPTRHKTLIFSQFTMALDVIEELLVARHWNWVRLDGATKYETRQEVVRLFNTTSHQELPVFLLSTRAGGLGLNLQASADTVIIHDSDWNPQLDLQAMDRCHRLGQEKPVLVLRFLSAASVEEVIYARAMAKRNLERLLLNDSGKKKSESPPKKRARGGRYKKPLNPDIRENEDEDADGCATDQAAEGDCNENDVDLFQLLENVSGGASEPIIDAENLADEDIEILLDRQFDENTPPFYPSKKSKLSECATSKPKTVPTTKPIKKEDTLRSPILSVLSCPQPGINAIISPPHLATRSSVRQVTKSSVETSLLKKKVGSPFNAPQRPLLHSSVDGTSPVACGQRGRELRSADVVIINTSTLPNDPIKSPSRHHTSPSLVPGSTSASPHLPCEIKLRCSPQEIRLPPPDPIPHATRTRGQLVGSFKSVQPAMLSRSGQQLQCASLAKKPSGGTIKPILPPIRCSPRLSNAPVSQAGPVVKRPLSHGRCPRMGLRGVAGKFKPPSLKHQPKSEPEPMED